MAISQEKRAEKLYRSSWDFSSPTDGSCRDSWFIMLNMSLRLVNSISFHYYYKNADCEFSPRPKSVEWALKLRSMRVHVIGRVLNGSQKMSTYFSTLSSSFIQSLGIQFSTNFRDFNSKMVLFATQGSLDLNNSSITNHRNKCWLNCTYCYWALDRDNDSYAFVKLANIIILAVWPIVMPGTSWVNQTRAN